MTQQSSLFLFALSLPLFSHFSCLSHFLFFAGHLVGFILVRKFWGKYFRILGLDERKGRWVVTQDFHGNFSGYGRGFRGEWVD